MYKCTQVLSQVQIHTWYYFCTSLKTYICASLKCGVVFVFFPDFFFLKHFSQKFNCTWLRRKKQKIYFEIFFFLAELYYFTFYFSRKRFWEELKLENIIHRQSPFTSLTTNPPPSSAAAAWRKQSSQ